MLFTKDMINHDSPIPLYKQVYDILDNLIENNVLYAGKSLPPEMQLARDLGVSRPTVRRAMDMLVLEGKIRRFRAKGTEATGKKRDFNYLTCKATFNEDKTFAGKTTVLVNDIETAPDDIDKMTSNVLGIHLVRVRYAKNVPVAYTDSWLDFQYSQILYMDMEAYSLYQAFDMIGNPPKYAHRCFKSMLPTPEIAKALCISKDTPILCAITTSYSFMHVPVEYTISYYRSDMVSFELDMNVDTNIKEFCL